MRRFVFGLFLLLSLTARAWAEPPDAATKLGRGLHNTTFGWFEIINEIGNESDRRGPWIGFPAGLWRGVFLGVGRTIIGVAELITFPFENGKKGYGPILLPETAFGHR